MDLISFWVQNNLDIVFFLYGLAFVVMGLAIWIQPKKGSSFKLADVLWLLCLFGLAHGVNEWLDMWAIIKGTNRVFDMLRSFILILSFFFLFEFGRQIHCLEAKPVFWQEKICRYLTWWLAPVLGIFIFLLGFFSPEPWKNINIWSRYLLCFPAASLSAYGLFLYYKRQEKLLKPLKVRRYFSIVSLAFLIYGILSGFIVPKSSSLLSRWINADLFFNFTRLPVQFFRAVCAITIAWAIVGILKIFTWESFEKLKNEIAQRKLAEDTLRNAHGELKIKVAIRTQELTVTNEILKKEIAQRKQREEENKRNYEMQAVISKLLSISLEDISLEEMLGRFIEQITSVSWLALLSSGGIFLVEDEPGVLVLKAQKGLSVAIQNMCEHVPFGRCYCGRVAMSKEIIFADSVDERHENRYEGMLAHGHYCVPIMTADKQLLGVLNLYIQQGWRREEKEKEFFVAIANVLAGVIQRKRADESLKAAYLKLQNTQDQLIQAEKLNAVGQLASGIAHEVRNPLGIITQGIGYLERKDQGNEKSVSEVLIILKDSVKRADEIINGLLDFSKVTTLSLQPQDLNSIVNSSLNLVRNQFQLKNVEIVTKTGKDIPSILVDKNKIEQVFINILLNAFQAMPQGGKIIIRSYVKELKEIKVNLSDKEKENFKATEKLAVVEFEDSGVGISQENINKMFDPFFTTKGPGGGTGLGLSVSRNILNMHKSLIFVESQLGRGTKITIIFKIAQGVTNG